MKERVFNVVRSSGTFFSFTTNIIENLFFSGQGPMFFNRLTTVDIKNRRSLCFLDPIPAFRPTVLQVQCCLPNVSLFQVSTCMIPTYSKMCQLIYIIYIKIIKVAIVLIRLGNRHNTFWSNSSPSNRYFIFTQKQERVFIFLHVTDNAYAI